jgi:predicted DNA-binding transcriptional regulator AlpA
MYTESSKADADQGGFEDIRILRFPAVVNKTGLSKSAIYGRIRRNVFPAPVALSLHVERCRRMR